jgi:nicotinate-nucleotide adenylyltransferase
VALLSGSFDPPTIAHVALAEAALAHVELVVFVYSVRTIAKEGTGSIPPALLGEAERLDAIDLVVGDRRDLAVAVASHGLLVDHLRAARDAWPSSELSLAMGSDKVLQLLDPAWYEEPEATLAELFGLGRVLFAVRTGEEAAVGAAVEASPWRRRFHALDVPPEVAAVSSRLVRERLRAGQDVRSLVPPVILPLLRLP